MKPQWQSSRDILQRNYLKHLTELIGKLKTPAIESFLPNEQACSFNKNSTTLQVFFLGEFYQSFQEKCLEEPL